MYLASQLTGQVSHVNLSNSTSQDPIFCDNLLKKVTIILYQTLNLIKKTNESDKSEDEKKDIFAKLAIIFRLIKLLKNTYNDSLYYQNWKFLQYFKNNYPDIYSSILSGRIEAQTAYKYCKRRSNRGDIFLRNLQNWITPENFIDWETCIGRDDEEVFLRELIRLIARYQTTAILMTTLSRKIQRQQLQIEESAKRILEFEAYFRALEIGGGLLQIDYLTQSTGSGGLEEFNSNLLPVVSVDGNGYGGVISIENGSITITKPGKDYTVYDIIYVEYNQIKYYFKVIHLTIPDEDEDTGGFAVATKIDLEQIDVTVPIWTRLYTSLYPASFDFAILVQIKDEVLTYGIQYVLIKHGCNEDVYDATLGRAF